MLVVRDGDVAAVELHGARFTSRSAPSRGGTELAMWTVEVPVGAGTPHRLDREEVLHVLAGRLVVSVDGESATLAAGDTVSVPPGSLLSVEAVEAPTRMLACVRAGLVATLADGTRLSPPWAS